MSEYDQIRQESIEVERRFQREVYKKRDENGKLEAVFLHVTYEKFKKTKHHWSGYDDDMYNVDPEFEWIVDINFEIGYHPGSWMYRKPMTGNGFVWRVGPIHIIW